MRKKRLVLSLSLTAVLAIGLTVAFAQPGADRSSRGGDRSQRGGGVDKGSTGGPRGGFDPNRMFSFMSGGKDYLDQNDINRMLSFSSRRDPNAKANLDRFMQQQNITNGTLTREQFAAYTAQQMAAAGAPGGPNPGHSRRLRPAAAPGSPSPSDEERIKDSFRRRDKNGDGILQPDEMSGTLREELDKWDKNKNGLIEYDEYKEYYLARTQFRNEQNGGNDRRGPGGQFDEFQPPPQPTEEKRVVYRRLSDLPKNLPPFFTQVPHRNPGQIALYEWKNANMSVEEFRKYDRNADGFITVEEVLAVEKKGGAGKQQNGQAEQPQEETLLVIAGPGAISDDSPLASLSSEDGSGSPRPGGGFQMGNFSRGGSRGGPPSGNTGGFSRGNRGGPPSGGPGNSNNNGKSNGKTRGNRGG